MQIPRFNTENTQKLPEGNKGVVSKEAGEFSHVNEARKGLANINVTIGKVFLSQPNSEETTDLEGSIGNPNKWFTPQGSSADKQLSIGRPVVSQELAA